MFGRRETVTMYIVNSIDNFRREIHFYIHWLLSKNLRTEMARTKALKNIHKGERCFIVGNGPSLKHHDLDKLKNEHVFTVNFMMKSDAFKILNSKYHLFVDPVVFGMNPENADEKKRIDLIASTSNTNPDLNFIIPYRRRKNFLKLFPQHNFHFIYNYKTYTKGIRNTSSLHSITPGFQNVIVYAINAAIYMGYKKIYLLGVDMTGFMEHFEYNKTNDKWGHSYSKTEEEKQKIKNYLAEHRIDNEFYLKTYGKTFEHLKLMQTNVLKNKAKLFNASAHGSLDFIPRVDYDKTLANIN